MKILRPHRRLLILALPPFALTACGNIIGPPAASQMYFLAMGPEPVDPGAKVGWSLAIQRPHAPDSLDSDRIAVTESDIKMDYYANAVWADRLPDLIQTRLLAGFEASGRIADVANEDDMLHADYTLVIDIRDFEAHYTNPDTPPVVTAHFVAHLINARSHKFVSSATANFTQICTVNNVNSVIVAFDATLTKAVALVVHWALDVLSNKNGDHAAG